MVQKGFISEEEARGPNTEYLQFYLSAFRELGTCRSSGMGEGPIPFTAIVEFARVYDVDDFEEFHGLIRLMDDTHLHQEYLKRKEQEKKNQIKPKEGIKNGNNDANASNKNLNRHKGKQRP